VPTPSLSALKGQVLQVRCPCTANSKPSVRPAHALCMHTWLHCIRRKQVVCATSCAQGHGAAFDRRRQATCMVQQAVKAAQQ
jgi:prolyl oligopeptidase PreP (S9A serine peptidase family)